MAAMKESTKNVLLYLQQNARDNDLTTDDVAEALGIPAKSVTGSFNSFTKKEKGWGYREEVETEDENGKTVKTKYLRLTDVGFNLDVSTL